MMQKNNAFARIFNILVYVFLYLPIVVLIIFSFNDSKSRTVWSGFSLHWYRELLQDQEILSAFSTTITVSVIAAVVATVLGTAAAIGFHNMKRRPRNLFMTINNIPMTNADIITGVSLMLLFVAAGNALGFSLGFGTLLLAQGKKYTYLGMLTLSVVANILCNMVTIPLWGKMGAAAASVVSYMVAGGCFLVYYLRTYKIPARDVFLFRPEELARLKGMLGKVKRKLGAKA